jgi:hypothetical protein
MSEFKDIFEGSLKIPGEMNRNKIKLKDLDKIFASIFYLI